MFATKNKGPRYLEMAEGYVSSIGLDENEEIIGYEYINLGRMMEMIKGGADANDALSKARGRYGRYSEAVKYLDPRKE